MPKFEIHRVIPGGYAIKNDYGNWDLIRCDGSDADPWYGKGYWYLQGPSGTLRAWDKVPPLVLLLECGLTVTQLEELGSRWKTTKVGWSVYRRVSDDRAMRIYYPNGNWKDYD